MLMFSRRLFVLASLLLLSACAPAGVAPREPFGPVDYRCRDGKAITVVLPDPDRAFLGIDGQAFALRRVPSGSGVRYATEQGLKPESGLIWWAKADEAMLIEMVLDHSVDPADYPLITSCRAR